MEQPDSIIQVGFREHIRHQNEKDRFHVFSPKMQNRKFPNLNILPLIIQYFDTISPPLNFMPDLIWYNALAVDTPPSKWAGV